MSAEEPTLELVLTHGEQEGEKGIMLDPQHLQAVTLSEIPHTATPYKQLCCDSLGERISQEIEDPVEHFDEKGKFGKDTGVDVVGKARVIGRLDGGEAAT